MIEGKATNNGEIAGIRPVVFSRFGQFEGLEEGKESWQVTTTITHTLIKSTDVSANCTLKESWMMRLPIISMPKACVQPGTGFSTTTQFGSFADGWDYRQ